ncbi:polyprenyl synthetase family protein [Aurantimonas endophytica]|uniref:Probable farnesyl diphosphate synthase n=1 Tax=Aurantimonas endophytica TaxID=1522175 RepID=A0A7W6HD81_9HYPH|nr:polyprenyl synthetase family protein [Aurantimonas endophytica]MBB4002911.1 geranylgeranyl diphosphate synthase type II [Aurantimonas endophytica]MCO6403788.1 polyprenyl synthetase family protein [Aurantimonas endophytica]
MTVDLKSGVAVYVRKIDQRLADLIPRAIPGQTQLDAAIAASVLAPGKRLRPLMTAIAAEDLGGDLAPAIDAGCAVEMVHAASLILDDLPSMDDATMRRGQPAVHITYGEDVAVLASIGVLAGAFEMLTTIETLPPAARTECIRLLTRAVGVSGLVGGQFEDLRGGRAARPVADIAVANGLKTGSLFSAAVEIGAVVAGADATTRSRLREFAAELGHAFQLLDDLLDGGSSAITIGKDIGKDIGKSTIVSMLGRPSVVHRIDRHVETAHARLNDVFGPAGRLHILVGAIFDTTLRARMAEAAGSETGLREQEAGAR